MNGVFSEIGRERNDFYWLTLKNRVNEIKIAEAFEFLEKNGFEPILIKGYAAARYYPESWRRIFGDIDLCVAPDKFEAAKKLVESPQGLSHNIDLHKGLRHLDNLSWEDLFQNSETIKIENTNVRVLRPEDHFRVLCVHWLTDGGAFKERLWDIYYLIENRPADFDWERCLNAAGPKRRKWMICCLGLAHKYLGLDISVTPAADAAGQIPRWLTRAVEKEWTAQIAAIPLSACLHDRKIFWRQVKKRIPPNPVQATVLLEGSFDERPRFFYQAGNILIRLLPAVKRILSKSAARAAKSIND